MSRRQSAKATQGNAVLLERIRAFNAEHPFWGSRRLWAHMQRDEGWPVKNKRVLRLLRVEHLLVKPTLRLRTARTPAHSTLRSARPNQ